MAKFIPLKDKNTGVVYEWLMVEDNGNETRKTLFKGEWKTEKEWTEKELEILFKVKKTDTKPVVAQIEEAVEDAPLFSEDFSTPGEE